MIMTYYSSTAEAKDVSAAKLISRRLHLCGRCSNTYENLVISRRSSSRVATEAMERLNKLEIWQKDAGNLERKRCDRMEREVLDEMSCCLSSQRRSFFRFWQICADLLEIW